MSSHHQWVHEPQNTTNPWVFRIGILVALLIAIALMALFGLFEYDWMSQLVRFG